MKNAPLKKTMRTIPVTFVNLPVHTVPISHRCDFVTLEGVRAIMGLSGDQALHLVENGKLLWTFNLGVKADGQKQNALRVWVNSIREPKAVEHLALLEVLAMMVGNREFFTRGELAIRWVLSRNTIKRLVRNELAEVNGRIGRASVLDFLGRRWIGNGGGQN